MIKIYSKIPSNQLSLISAGLQISSTFLCFRITAHYSGVGSIGVYSLAVASLFLLRLADFSINAAAMRYVGKNTNYDFRFLAKVVLFCLLINLLTFSIVLMPALFLFRKALNLSIGSGEVESLQTAYRLIPFLILTSAFQLLSSTFSSIVLGTGHVRVVYTISAVNAINLIPLTVVLVHSNGIVGYALSILVGCVISAILFIIFMYTAFRRPVKINPEFYYRDLLGISGKLTINSMLATLIDPAIKLCLGRYGTAHVVGLYEVYTRIFNQLRTISLAPMNPLFIQMIRELNSKKVTDIYNKSMAYCMFICIVVGIMTPLMYFIVNTVVLRDAYGNINIFLLCFVVFLSGFMGVPSYNYCIASGKIYPVIASTISAIVLVVCLTPLGKYIMGLDGLLLATSFSMFGANMVLVLLNAKANKTPPFPLPAQYFSEWRAFFLKYRIEH